MWLVSLGILVFQHDLGSSLLFFGLFLIMLYVATERAGWLVVGGALFVVGSYLRRTCFIAHVRERFQLWSDVWAHYGDGTDDKGRQTVETMFGMAYGGLIGRGLGQGSPWRIPFAQSDFIFGAIGEELGLTGVDRGDPALRPDRRARAARRADLPRRHRQAARHRPRRRDRAPGLRGRSAASPT